MPRSLVCQKARRQAKRVLKKVPNEPEKAKKAGKAVKRGPEGKSAVNPGLRKQTVDYAVYQANGKNLSAANNFYTHKALAIKNGRNYRVILTVKVKRGLAFFKPLTAAGRKVATVSRYSRGQDDFWRYSFYARAKQLNKPVKATIRLSVPSVGIHKRFFVVWLKFGKKYAGQTSKGNTAAVLAAKEESGLAPASLAPVEQNEARGQSRGFENNVSSAAAGRSSRRPDSQTVFKKTRPLKPEKEKLAASINRRNYPFTQTKYAFAAAAALMIAVTLFARRKIAYAVKEK